MASPGGLPMGRVYDDGKSHWDKMQADSASRRTPAEEAASLKDGDGGGTSGGMEARLAKLEAQMEHVQADLAKLAGLPVDLAGLKVQVDNLPTKDYLKEQLESHLRKTGILFAIVGAIFGVAFKLIG